MTVVMRAEAINNHVKEIKKLEQKKKELEEMIDTHKSFLKDEMLNRDVEELRTDLYTIRYTPVISSRFDTSTFKKENTSLYEAYLKESCSKRFSIV